MILSTSALCLDYVCSISLVLSRIALVKHTQIRFNALSVQNPAREIVNSTVSWRLLKLECVAREAM